jgi:hypothetical protein
VDRTVIIGPKCSLKDKECKEESFYIYEDDLVMYRVFFFTEKSFSTVDLSSKIIMWETSITLMSPTLHLIRTAADFKNNS